MEWVISLLQLILDIISLGFSKRIRKNDVLKNSLRKHKDQITDVINNYSYFDWNVLIRNKKLEILYGIQNCIEKYATTRTKTKLENSLNIEELIKNIDEDKNIDDLIKIKAIISDIVD